MAQKSDLREERSIVWETRKAAEGSKTASSVFSLLGAKWQLEMTGSIIYGYTLYLRRIGSSEPSRPFSVLTSVQCRTPLEGITFRTNKAKITERCSVLWMHPNRTAQGAVTVEVNNKVTVFCVLTDIPCATSGVLNETVEAMTQTDIELALSVKKIHALSLSSDECEQGSSSLSPNLDSLSRDLSKLLEGKVVSDLNLRCGDRTIAAHKAILAARSQVFSAMFQSRMLESETGVVDIADLDVQVLDMFLNYVYSGRLPDMSDELLPSLYTAADKYAVGSLKTACSERMISNLTRKNCLNVLFLANAHCDQDFKKAIFNFILNHMEILKSEEWDRFCLENPILTNQVYQTVVQQKCF